MKATNKSILKVCLITILIFVLTIIIIFGGFLVIFPRPSAKVMYSLGNYDWASNFYFEDFKRTYNIDSLYKSLSIDVSRDKSLYIEQKSTVFFEHPNHVEFLKNRETTILNSKINILIKGASLYEKNALMTKYVEALIINKGTEGFNLAMTYAIDNFTNSKKSDIYDIENYLFTPIIKNAKLEEYSTRFNEIYSKVSETDPLYKAISNYFLNLKNIFNDNFDIINCTEKKVSYLIATRNRLENVGSDLKKLNNVFGNSTNVLWDTNNDIIDNELILINSKLSQFLK